MIICIDFDNVINNLTEKTLETYNAQKLQQIQMSDLTTYNFDDCLSKKDAEGIMKLFKNKGLWDALKPIAGSREALQQLIDAGHKIYIVTATSQENFPWKIQWLKKWFPFFNSDNVIRIMDKSLLKCDILIEDSLEQLIKHKLCHRICLDYPWNHNVEDFIYAIHRCKNWNEILNEINKIEEEIKSYE